MPEGAWTPEADDRLIALRAATRRSLGLHPPHRDFSCRENRKSVVNRSCSPSATPPGTASHKSYEE
jgi:hypothetical protein